jgi:hypothetical protein
MRCGEAKRLKWKSVDFGKTITTPNDPEKQRESVEEGKSETCGYAQFVATPYSSAMATSVYSYERLTHEDTHVSV